MHAGEFAQKLVALRNASDLAEAGHSARVSGAGLPTSAGGASSASLSSASGSKTKGRQNGYAAAAAAPVVGLPARGSVGQRGYAAGIGHQQASKTTSASGAANNNNGSSVFKAAGPGSPASKAGFDAVAATAATPPDRTGSLSQLNNALRNELGDLELQLREAERAAYIPQPVTAILAPLSKGGVAASAAKKKKRASTKLDWSIPSG